LVPSEIVQINRVITKEGVNANARFLIQAEEIRASLIIRFILFTIRYYTVKYKGRLKNGKKVQEFATNNKW
jgi:hypothetical protein